MIALRSAATLDGGPWRFLALIRRPGPWDGAPIREELFSAERLEEHARSLAIAQTEAPKGARGRPLAGRLANNGTALLAAYRSIVKTIGEGGSITPAAEWLVDNYHLVERQIRALRRDLPAGYYRQLPKLASGPLAGYPRVFGIAWAFVAHTDSRFDVEMLVRFVDAYQEAQPLTIGELWAVSITLRIVLIENLRRLAGQITKNRASRQAADRVADRLLGSGERNAEPAPAVLAIYERAPIAEAFAVQLLHRLRDQDPRIAPALAWLDERLALQGTTADAVVRDVHRNMGAGNVTVRNIITGIRMIADVDWAKAFERLSHVDAAFAAAGPFKANDLATRTLYRSAVEELSRGSLKSELEIARSAIAHAERAAAAAAPGERERLGDPGHALIGGGRREFEAAMAYRPAPRDWARRANAAVGVGGYLAMIAVAGVASLSYPIVFMGLAGYGAAGLCVLGLLGAIPAIDAAVALVNRAVSASFAATLLPALGLRDGVPSGLRTLVAVPTLLTTQEAVEAQVEQLEIHHLASPEGDLHFALLSDWADAEGEHAEGDAALVAAAERGVARLNERYGPAPGGARFLLLHRRRVWSESEGAWIGWERKRGKLHELNRLLRGATDTTFVAGGAQSAPSDVHYVVTLDADTRLPRDTVRRLIGKMAHPLNKPRFDEGQGRVVEGYAILQPRVTPSLPVGREGSTFQRMFSSLSGIDPYASAASDVYQDLFGEGSYAGKGIYDIDAFERALRGRAPDATLLSHDLFEGIFARAGLASDVEVVEEFPSRYDVGALRHHRWARGDWQLLPWIFGRGPNGGGEAAAHRSVPAVGRWKMLDNLRRTLSAPAAILALFAGWTLPFSAALLWTLFVVVTIALPTLIPVIDAIPPRRPGVTISSHLWALAGDMRFAATLSLLIFAFEAHQAWLMGDAIARTLWRLAVSRRHLLEWTPAAQSVVGPPTLRGFARQMAGAPVIGALALGAAAIAGHGTWILAAPFALLWLASPAIAFSVSLSPSAAQQRLASDLEIRDLRRTARRTWRYFEAFVTSAEHHLPPDNFQEDPFAVVARRTSPTNIGLYLLSAACARDFGWIGLGEAIKLLEATLGTLKVMERVRGHFYNWYDTSDLRPLDPKYVSSVDSGNLAGHLIALANACREWRGPALADAARVAGIVDVVAIAREEFARLGDGRRARTGALAPIDVALAILEGAAGEAAPTEADQAERLERMSAAAAVLVDAVEALALERGGAECANMRHWAKASLGAIEAQRADARRSHGEVAADEARLKALEDGFRTLAMAMEFGFLLDQDRQLLSIGYLPNDDALDSNCYDLLASEARLASFFAIAKGDLPARHWFRLGRSAIPVAHGAALISWSGSMFEYLMPSLVMRAPAGSLLEQTSRLIVRRQIDYATKRGLPWGISESAYNARDLELTYQYSNFGVPGLGLKRGLAENLVVAPYATALAAMVDPSAATANLARLAAMGMRGDYGFYEALDATPSRVPAGQPFAAVRAFMAHHQGMTIVAVANVALLGAMRERFHAEPIIQATELLLQERMPRDVASARPWAAEVKSAAGARDLEPSGGRRFANAQQSTPATHLLSNGRYSILLTAAGSGYSRWGDLAVTRWREDATSDDFGSYIFLRDVGGGALWSAGFQPLGIEPDEYEAIFEEDRAQFIRRDGALTTTTEIIVSTEDDAEVRRISITNSSGRPKDIEITSYAELVLGPQSADIAHPAFAKLFVETEYLAKADAILATRRKRSPGEAEIWAAHVAVVEGESVGAVEYETDRARFIGRGRSARAPAAMVDGRPLSNTAGAVIDPVFALRRRVRIAPGATARVAFWTLAASTREAALAGVDKHQDATAFARASTLVWTQAQVQLHHLGVSAGQAGLFQRLAGHILFCSPAMRPSPQIIARGVGPQSGLWALGISGDLPIVVLRIADVENLDVAHELLSAHEYWRMKRLAVDLVIVNERQSSYVQDLQIGIETLVRARQPEHVPQEGRIFALRSDLISAEARGLLASVARVVIVAQRGTLSEQLERIPELRPAVKAMAARRAVLIDPERPPRVPDLEFFNGLGGFANEGKDYLIVLGPGQSTPAPWINVVANPDFGFQSSAEGSGYTWALNSRENQLTPWSNDPVGDPAGEAFYLRDQDSGELWSPTASPMRNPNGTYMARHGRGFSQFDHSAYGVDASLRQFVPMDAPIKISRLTLKNRTVRARRLGVTAYVEWVLGQARSATSPFVATEFIAGSGAIFARNPWGLGFGSRVAFAAWRGVCSDATGDRREFIGRNGKLSNPAGLAGGAPLSGRMGAGLDPCAALRTMVDLAPNASVEVVFMLGEASGADEARALLARFAEADLDASEGEVERHWRGVLEAVAVKTPVRSMDIMLNGWLLYQTLACRIWARSAFYQASGAYGFRDQLQDGMAIAQAQPQLTRAHLLRAAGRQFVEGDVQHWWLPHSGQGVRTRISDDRAWLAAAVAHYVGATGDAAVLDEPIPFLEGQALQPGEHDSFTTPGVTDLGATLFEHCARALDHSLALGGHGLPLMGTGDWNDGMNRVGEAGLGESVWLGWFLHAALSAFVPLAASRGERPRAEKWATFATALRASLEREAWDGQWYRRGFYDDGSPLGSALSQECQIDSIAQSWAALSGASARAAQAMDSMERRLIRRDDGLALLFTPPFDKSSEEPGYIKGYPPGMRENGGQYTHAALWSVMAWAALGEGDKAFALFSMLNPINHARSRADVQRYKVEPYVVAADIYATPPHVGRGGWTWYTGSAGWMQRAGVEGILGLRIAGAFLTLDPCIPKEWPGYSMILRHREARYEIVVENPGRVGRGIVSCLVDGAAVLERPLRITMREDGMHQVILALG